MPNETISLTEAAERLGVHYMTAYRYVRTGRLGATKVGAEWRVPASAVEAIRAGRSEVATIGGPAPAGPGGGRRRRRDYHLRLADRLVAGDEGGAWSIVESAMTAGLEPAAVYLEVLAPAMTAIGDGWEAGTITVAEEHRASVVALRLVGRLGPRFVRRGRTRGTVVLGAPAGDHHGVPVALAADLVRSAGFTVADLGADTPASSFVDAARTSDRLVAVGINATHDGNQDAIQEAIAALHHEIGCPIVLGGRAVAGEPAQTFGADEMTTSADDLIAVLDRLARHRVRAS